MSAAQPTRGELAAVAAGGLVVLTAAALLERTLRPTLEAREYIKDTKGATEALERNLRALAGFARTRDATRELLRAAGGGAA